MDVYHGCGHLATSLADLSGQEGWLAPRFNDVNSELQSFICIAPTLTGERGQAHLPDLTNLEVRSLRRESGGKPTLPDLTNLEVRSLKESGGKPPFLT